MIIITEEGESGSPTESFSYAAGWNPLTRLVLPVTRWLRAINTGKYIGHGQRHLDIGCGDGYFLRRSLSKTRIGIDKKLGDNLSDINNFEENYFDYVTMLAVIEHIKKPGELFKDIRRVLKPNGKLVITTPKKTAEILINLYSPDIKDEHEIYYDLKTIKELAAANNFRLAGHHTFILGLNQVFCLQKPES